MKIKFLNTRAKKTVFMLIIKKLKLTCAACTSGVLLELSCDSIAAPRLKRSLTISAPACVPLDAQLRGVP